MHHSDKAWEAFPKENVIELMDATGVAMALVSSTPDEGTLALWTYAPGRVVPQTRPYGGRVNQMNWAKTPDIAAYIEGQLEAHPMAGIGEFHIHRLDRQDAPLFRQIIKMAKARDMPLHVHSAAAAIVWLYVLDPEVKIIWAHAGLSASAETVYQMMETHPTLWADTSLRELVIMKPKGGLNPKWERILIDFQDRIMIGSDTWSNSQWENYEGIIEMNRRMLSYLPRDVAEKLAYKNAERLFGREVNQELIGTR